ncbi:DUF3618 domain-containing protein [Nocardia beijingensis]|uniref:DUF3618 domain-containing protein n=1 Tax=Nocardia beijingensis TaxID=95162 RepID=UPI0018949DF1|nr:DUF3618 domain-containing protein [Nocardia beijingensis]MBF6074141.1 DUF3618 domain-containing protein [Nocardia beijingensis]
MSDSRPGAGGPTDDVAALRRDRDQARADLGRTVEELGHKLDVPARGKEKAQEAVAATQHAASEAALAVADKAQQARTGAADLAHRAVAATPEPVAERGRQAGGVLRAYPIPAAIGAGVLAALVWQIVRRRR